MPTYTHDHELNIDGTVYQFDIMKDANGSAMYAVIEDVPEHQGQLRFIQDNWIGGHGRFNFAKSRYSDEYFEGQSIDTTKEGKIMLGPLITEVKENDDTTLDSAPVCFMWFGTTSEWLCATSGKIYRYNVSSNLKWTAASTTVAGVTHMVEYNGVAYAFIGTGTYLTSTDGITWTATNLTDDDGVFGLSAPNAAGTSNVIWKTKNTNQIASTTNGVTGGTQWSSPAYIGDTSSNITNIFLVNDKLMIGKTDNLYWYDSDGGVHPLMDELKLTKNTNNFKYVTEWQSGTYFSLGTHLGSILGGYQFDRWGPLFNIDDIGKSGTCVGLTSDEDYMYVAMDEGTNTIIYKIREVRKEGWLRWEICPWVFLSTNACATIKVCVHSSTDKRLWIGYGTHTAYVPISDDPTSFAASGWVRMSYTYGTNPYWDKMFQSVVLQTEGCSSTVTVTPKYRKDTDTSAITLTPIITTNGVVKTNFTTALSCKRIQFELHLATASSASTPEVSYFEARGTEKPETTRAYDVTYVIGDDPSNRTKTLRDLFRAGRTSTTLMKFADLRFGQKTSGSSSGDYVWVVMMPGYPKEVEIPQIKGKQPELGIACKFQEINYTIT